MGCGKQLHSRAHYMGAVRCRPCNNVSERSRMLGKHHSRESKEKLRKVLTGRIFSKEWRRKLSESAKGRIFSESHRKNISKVKTGIKISEETKRKMGRKLEQNANWRGGKSFEEYGREFDSSLKEQIRFKGNYKCQVCGCSQLENGRQLDCHHIDYNKKNAKLNNLIALCRKCHSKTNNNREYWEKYFTKETREEIFGIS